MITKYRRFRDTNCASAFLFALITLLCLHPLYTKAQLSASQPISLAKQIVIDGVDNEAAWGATKPIKLAHQHFPADSVPAQTQTEVKIFIDKEFFYVFANLVRLNSKQPYVISTLKRDFVFLQNDAFSVVIDPFQDNTNGYVFSLNAAGAQREAQLSAGYTLDLNWNIAWKSAVKQTAESWQVEMAIPLQFLRFKSGKISWNLNFIRNDVAANEIATWAKVPRNYTVENLAYLNEHQWSTGPSSAFRRFSFLPSLTAVATNAPANSSIKFRPALDAKVVVNASLSLDVTVNPDFSQADADQVQNNLSRFELIFPETRPFFIENSDLFSRFGTSAWGAPSIRPFYSRRIGLYFDTTVKSYQQATVLGGLRLTGKLNPSLRFGLFTVQTAAVNKSVGEQRLQLTPAENYTVLALQQKVFNRSSVSVFLANKQSFFPDSLKITNDRPMHDRVAGAEYNLASKNDAWTGKVFSHFQFNAAKNTVEMTNGVHLDRHDRRIEAWTGANRISRNFNPETGFVPRRDVLNAYLEFGYVVYPKIKKVFAVKPLVHYSTYYNHNGQLTDRRFIMGGVIRFQNTASFFTAFVKDFVRLDAPFDPSQRGLVKLPKGSSYDYGWWRLYYASDTRKEYSGSAILDWGRFYNGNFTSVTVNLSKRVQPWGSIGVRTFYNSIRLPQPYSDNYILYVGPQAELAYSKSLFHTTSVQYNSSTKALLVFSRVQWHFRPMSDLFVVYTHNKMGTDDTHNSLAVKLAWWL